MTSKKVRDHFNPGMIEYHLVNESETARGRVDVNTCQPSKMSIKYQRLICYDHRNKEFITVDVKYEATVFHFKWQF